MGRRRPMAKKCKHFFVSLLVDILSKSSYILKCDYIYARVSKGTVVVPGARKWGTNIDRITHMSESTEGICKASQGIQF